MDAAGLVLYDSRIQAATPENIGLIFTQEYWSNHARTALYRPATTLSYLVNYAILRNGTNPAGYHWFNFALHALNIALVYLLGWKLLRQAAPALALAAIWGLHPVATESVTNIAGRADLLSGFGVLAALLCHISAAGATGARKIVQLTGLSLAAAIGLFSKESAVAVLALMALYDLTFRIRSWRACIPGYAALLLPMAIFFYVRHQALAPLPAAHVSFADNPLLGADFWTARLTAIKVIGNYLALLLWPAHLCCDYSFNQVPLVSWRFRSWEDWKAVAALTACLLAGGAAILSYRRCKPAFYFTGFFCAALAPTANLLLLIGAIMAERFLYLPSIGFAGCLVIALYAAGARLPAGWPARAAAVPLLLALICMALGARTFARNRDWTNPHTMAASAVRTCPASFKTHLMQAIALLDWGSTDDSIRELQQAVRILDPLPDVGNAAIVYLRAGAVCRMKGDRLAALASFDSRGPGSESIGWYQEALRLLQRAERIDAAVDADTRRQNVSLGKKPFDTGLSLINLELGRTYLRLHAPQEAIASLQNGLARALTAEMLVELSGAYQAAGQPRAALMPLLEALVIRPDEARLMAAAAALYQKADPQGCAVRRIGGRVELNMECPLIQEDKCAAYRYVTGAYRQFGYALPATRPALVQDCAAP